MQNHIQPDTIKLAICAGMKRHMGNNGITPTTAVRYHCEDLTIGQMSKILNGKHDGVSIEKILRVAAELCVACSMKVTNSKGDVSHNYVEELAILGMRADNTVYQMQKNIAVSIRKQLKALGLSQSAATRDSFVSCTRNDLNRICNLKFEGHSLRKLVETAEELGLSCEMVVKVPKARTDISAAPVLLSQKKKIVNELINC